MLRAAGRWMWPGSTMPSCSESTALPTSPATRCNRAHSTVCQPSLPGCSVRLPNAAKAEEAFFCQREGGRSVTKWAGLGQSRAGNRRLPDRMQNSYRISETLKLCVRSDRRARWASAGALRRRWLRAKASSCAAPAAVTCVRGWHPLRSVIASPRLPGALHAGMPGT